MTILDDVKTHVEKGKAKLVPGLVQTALDEGVNPVEILDAMVAAMGVVGDKFSANEIFVPEMLMSAHAMKSDREQCLTAGMDGYLKKPVQISELKKALESEGPPVEVDDQCEIVSCSLGGSAG